MVPGSWLIACLLLGAGAVYAVPCVENGCPLRLDDGAIDANDFACSVLTRSGLEPLMVSGDAIFDPIAVEDIDDPFGLHSAPTVMVALSSVAGQELGLSHVAADTGVVEIDGSVCTLCGQCAKACPTHALTEIYDGEAVFISFDARACVNCAQCVSACPELRRGAISVTGRVDVGLLTDGRLVLNQGVVASCEVCGKTIAPSAMMERIGDLLGDEFAATTARLESRCLDCRGRR
jgi:ferredoxin